MPSSFIPVVNAVVSAVVIDFGVVSAVAMVGVNVEVVDDVVVGGVVMVAVVVVLFVVLITVFGLGVVGIKMAADADRVKVGVLLVWTR